MTEHREAFSGRLDDAKPRDVGDTVDALVRGRVTAVTDREDAFGRVTRTHTVKVEHTVPADAADTDRLDADIARARAEIDGQTTIDDAATLEDR